MKILAKSLTQLILGTVAGIGVVSLLLPQPSWAGPNDLNNEANPLKDFGPDQNSDPFSRNNDGNGLGIFDLIHRAQLGSMRYMEDFSAEQNENLDAATAEFRARQRQRIQGQPSQVNTVTTPQPSN